MGRGTVVIRKRIKNGINFFLGYLGVNLVSVWDVRLNGHQVYHRRRNRLLKERKVSAVLDIGANTGQYAAQLREEGFRGKIISFEPMPKAFQLLSQRAKKDPNWVVLNYALGDFSGNSTFNEASFDQASSILGFTQEGGELSGQRSETKKYNIRVCRLDEVWESLGVSCETTWVKLDVQGYTAEVLAGMGKLTGQFAGMEVELETLPLYTGQKLLPEVVFNLHQFGFRLAGWEDVFWDEKTDRLLSLNGLFVRDSDKVHG